MSESAVTIILAVIAAVTSTVAAYFGNRNHNILNGGSTIQITHKAVPPEPVVIKTEPVVIKTIVVDGITYTQKV
jgi:hypothetical protein